MDSITHAPNILEFLDGIPFPATKIEIADFAQDQDASEEAMDIILAMPDRVYNTMEEINVGIGEISDVPGTDPGWWNTAEESSLPRFLRQKVADRLRGPNRIG